jgi:hypothetical protein
MRILMLRIKEYWVNRLIIASFTFTSLFVYIVASNGQTNEGSMSRSQSSDEKRLDPTISSLMGVSVGYAEALDRIDVLVRSRTSFDNVGKRLDVGLSGLTRDTEAFYRLTLDFQSKRGQWIDEKSVKQVFFPSENLAEPQNSDQRYFAAGGVDHALNAYLVISSDEAAAGPISELRDSEHVFWGHLRVKDVRSLFGGLAGGLGLSFEESKRQIGSGTSQDIRRSRLPNGNQVMEYSTKVTDRGYVDLRYEIQDKTDLIVGYSYTSHPPVGSASAPMLLNSIDRIDWKQINDIYVPISIRGRKMTQFSVGGKNDGGLESFVHTLHWFSVNEEVAPAVFLPHEVLRDEIRCRELLDPKLTHSETTFSAKKVGTPD